MEEYTARVIADLSALVAKLDTEAAEEAAALKNAMSQLELNARRVFADVMAELKRPETYAIPPLRHDVRHQVMERFLQEKSLSKSNLEVHIHTALLKNVHSELDLRTSGLTDDDSNHVEWILRANQIPEVACNIELLVEYSRRIYTSQVAPFGNSFDVIEYSLETRFEEMMHAIHGPSYSWIHGNPNYGLHLDRRVWQDESNEPYEDEPFRFPPCHYCHEDLDDCVCRQGHSIYYEE